ncbi:MAG: aminotransferase class I/II-fold pyridoxal phosphate-dependent enzyme, partial [Candidatus Micrarchaeota archaeon]|nr:aminotransferase class I/II-fold pyridoxal phosphate-dependent enzyme [Candidatus Micrarchaeota archaeon]
MATALGKWREGKPSIIDPRLAPWTRGEGTIFQQMEALVSEWERKTGKKGIRLAWGNPTGEIGAPLEIRQALARIILQQVHGYAPPVGYANFREIIAQELSNETGQKINADDIFVCAGATGAMETIVKYAVRPGSAVFLPERTYPPFLTLIDQKIALNSAVFAPELDHSQFLALIEQGVMLGGGKAYYYRIREDGQPDTEHLKQQIQKARDEGMRTLVEAGIEKVIRGITTLEEVAQLLDLPIKEECLKEDVRQEV